MFGETKRSLGINAKHIFSWTGWLVRTQIIKTNNGKRTPRVVKVFWPRKLKAIGQGTLGTPYVEIIKNTYARRSLFAWDRERPMFVHTFANSS